MRSFSALFVFMDLTDCCEVTIEAGEEDLLVEVLDGRYGRVQPDRDNNP